MRKLIVLILAALFCAAGPIIAIAGIRFGLAHDSRDDIWAAAFMGGMLTLIGVVLFFVAAKAGKGRADLGTITAVGMAHMINMNDGADDIGGDTDD